MWWGRWQGQAGVEQMKQSRRIISPALINWIITNDSWSFVGWTMWKRVAKGEFTHWQNWYFLLTGPQLLPHLTVYYTDPLWGCIFMETCLAFQNWTFNCISSVSIKRPALSAKTWGLPLNRILTNEDSIWPLQKCCRVASALRKVYFLTAENTKVETLSSKQEWLSHTSLKW